MKHERILLDVEVQRDLFSPGGSCYTKEASSYAARIYELFSWARRQRVPVISTLLRIRGSERGPLAPIPHCVDGTDGERKLARTVLPRRINLGLRNTTDLPEDLFDDYQQAIFEKRHTDIFAHTRAERLITTLAPCTFILCGAGMARGIVEAAVGLRNRGFAVIAAEDACLGLGDPRDEMSRLRMEAKGVLFLPTKRIVTEPVAARRRSRPMKTPAGSEVRHRAS
jgi:nicotinamidase-related amidase